MRNSLRELFVGFCLVFRQRWFNPTGKISLGVVDVACILAWEFNLSTTTSTSYTGRLEPVAKSSFLLWVSCTNFFSWTVWGRSSRTCHKGRLTGSAQYFSEWEGFAGVFRLAPAAFWPACVARRLASLRLSFQKIIPSCIFMFSFWTCKIFYSLAPWSGP